MGAYIGFGLGLWKKKGGGGAGPSSGILMENGDFMIMENSDFTVQE